MYPCTSSVVDREQYLLRVADSKGPGEVSSPVRYITETIERVLSGMLGHYFLAVLVKNMCVGERVLDIKSYWPPDQGTMTRA